MTAEDAVSALQEGPKILITLAGMIVGYSLLAMSQFSEILPPAASALGGLGILTALALTTARWVVHFIVDWISTTPDSIFSTPVFWLLGILSVIVLMPIALLIMIVRWWQSKRKAA